MPRLAVSAVSALLFITVPGGRLFAGSAVGPNYHPPQPNVPATYSARGQVRESLPDAALAHWWKLFKDAQLDALVDEAMRNNHDVRIALARVREARALRISAASAFYPSIDSSGGYTRERTSPNGPGGLQAAAFQQPVENNLFQTSLDMNWEVDVFGGTRRTVEAAQADIAAAQEDVGATLISVLAEVGLNYLDLRGAQKQLQVARENLHTQEETLALTRDRRQAGLSSELDSARAEAQAESTQAQIPPLEEQVAHDIHRIGVLLGRPPEELEKRLRVVRTLPVPVPGVPVGLPSDLVRRRPDIRRAERQLAAANARIGIATADLFPRFFLTGAAGLESINASDFVTLGSRFWSLGPSIRWPIFTAGRIRGNIRAANAREEQALSQYEQTVLTSLEEVENALVAFGKEQVRYHALSASQEATKRSVVLATDRYKGGLEDFLTVLEAQRSLLAIEDETVRSEKTLSQNAVRLYKAFGGGWSSPVTTISGRTEPSKTKAKGRQLVTGS